MKVRFLGFPSDGSGERSESAFLTVGQDYVVFAILVPSTRPLEYLLVTDQGDPSWFRVSLFDLVADEVPSNWRVKVGDGGSPGRIEITPKSWMERGFWEDYWGDNVTTSLAAKDVFEREAEIILRESG